MATNGNGTTLDAETGQPVTTGPKPILGTTPSIISIPPQISTTIVWISVGFALGVWLMSSRSSKKSLF